MGTNDVNGQFFENYLLRNERWLVGTSERNGEHQTDNVISEDEIAAFFCKNNLDDELHNGNGLAGDDFDTWYEANEEAISAYYEAQDEYDLEYGTDEAKEFMLEAMSSYLDSVDSNPDLDIDITNLADSRIAGTRNSITRGLADTLGVSATTSLDTYKTLASNSGFINDNFQYEPFDTTGLTRNEIKREQKWAHNATESIEYTDSNGNVLKRDKIGYSGQKIRSSEIFDTNGNLLRTEYYSNGKLSSIEAPDENGNMVRYSVDENGNIKEITVKDTDGNTIESVSADFENGVLASTSKTKDGNKETTTYKDGKPTQTSYSGSFNATITYDSDGEPKEARRKTTVDGNTVYEQLNSSGKPTGKYFNADGTEYVPQAQQPASGTPTGGTAPTGGTTGGTAPTGGAPAGGTSPTEGGNNPVVPEPKVETLADGTKRVTEYDESGNEKSVTTYTADGTFRGKFLAGEDGEYHNVPESAESVTLTDLSDGSKRMTAYNEAGKPVGTTVYNSQGEITSKTLVADNGTSYFVNPNVNYIKTETLYDGSIRITGYDGTPTHISIETYTADGTFRGKSLKGSDGVFHDVPQTAVRTEIEILNDGTKRITLYDPLNKTAGISTFDKSGNYKGKFIAGNDGTLYSVEPNVTRISVHKNSDGSRTITYYDGTPKVVGNKTYTPDEF